MKAILILYHLSFLTPFLDGAKILVVLPLPLYSHTNTFMPVFKELAHRGHNITMVSPFPQKKPIPNWTDLTVNATSATGIAEYWVKKMVGLSPHWFFSVFWNFCSDIIEVALQDETVQKLIKAEDLHYDLLILESFFAHEPLVALGHKFNVPVVSVHPLSLSPWLAYVTGNELSFSATPNFRTSYTNKMSFFQRLDNMLINLIEFSTAHLFYVPRQEKLMEKYLVYPGSKKRPSMMDMLKDVSLTLIDYHFSIGYVETLQPNTIPVGGLTLRNEGELPKDLQEIMDKSKNGVIYLSFGSFIKSDFVQKNSLQFLLQAFRRLDVTVLMKWDLEISDKPKNVEVRKWFPQPSILAHPNLRLFITHAGLHSVTEAAYFGVPLICIPFFTDQMYNSRFVEETGFGLPLLQENVTSETVYSTITAILNNPKFKKTALERSKIVKDRPHTAVESAVYWVEYVLSHRGAKHLKPARSDLLLYELLCLDVALFLAFLIAIPLALCMLLRCCIVRKDGVKDKTE